MSAVEYDDIARLIAAHRRRLVEMRITEAELGTATPPHIRTEIRLITEQIADLSGAPAVLTEREQHLIDQQWKMRLEADVYLLRREVREMSSLFRELLPNITAIAAYVASVKAPLPPKPRPTRRVNGE